MDISESKSQEVFQIERLVTRKLEGNLNDYLAFKLRYMKGQIKRVYRWYASSLSLAMKREEYLKRAIEFYFNKVDTDKNGVITVPEFMKLALSFSEENKDDDSVVAEVPVF